MANIIVPGDRTSKQPARGFCTNPECLESSDDDRFEFDVQHGDVVCPKCGCDHAPTVGLLVLIHYLVKDPKGRIRGLAGRYRLACDSQRAYLATTTNQEAATGDLRHVNCPGCLAAVQSAIGKQVQKAKATS